MITDNTNNKWNTSVDAATLDAAWKGIGTKRARARSVRRMKKLVAAPLLTAMIAILLVIVARQSRSPSSSPAAPALIVSTITLQGGSPLPPTWDSANEPRTIDLVDGSHLLLAKGSLLKTLPSRDPARVEMVLESGDVTFDIKPGGPRAWLIDAGNGTHVRVLGTRFKVTRDRRHVHVAVERGKVRVENARLERGGRDLVAGQDVDVQNGADEAAVSSPPQPPSIPVENLTPAKPSTSAPRKAAPAPTAESVQQVQTTTTMPTATSSDRFADADAARKAGRSRDAVAILKGAVEASDRPALAAFTIGKIHAEELREPAASATWFERAIHLGLASGLEEDAYARVAECHGQAGHADEAARAAARYEAKFPSGRHLARVQRWKR
jgi:transmembrane sensor